MSQPSEREIRLKLKAMLQPQNGDIKRLQQLFKLSYTDAALLLLNYHLNDMHAIANMWFKANVKVKGPE